MNEKDFEWCFIDSISNDGKEYWTDCPDDNCMNCNDKYCPEDDCDNCND